MSRHPMRFYLSDSLERAIGILRGEHGKHRWRRCCYALDVDEKNCEPMDANAVYFSVPGAIIRAAHRSKSGGWGYGVEASFDELSRRAGVDPSEFWKWHDEVAEWPDIEQLFVNTIRYLRSDKGEMGESLFHRPGERERREAL